MQVYAVLYSAKGNFLMGCKADMGYFFHGSGGGTIYKDGVLLNGAGKPALPGGKLEGGNVTAGAQKEFMEECGAKISFSTSELIIDQERYTLLASTPWTPVAKGYCAAYFKVDDDALGQITYIIQETNLREAREAMDDIISQKITEYKTIALRYPYCPADNELKTAAVWNLTADAGKIDALGKDEDTDWFHAILVQLQKIIGN